MKLSCSLVLLSLSTALAGFPANAADYFVKAISPGPVSGTALSIISLQSGGSALKSDYLKTKDSSGAGKWLTAPKGKNSTSTTTTTDTSGGTSSTSETTTTTTTGSTDGSGTTTASTDTSTGTTTTTTTDTSGSTTTATTGDTSGSTTTTSSGSTTGSTTTTTSSSTNSTAPSPVQSPSVPPSAQLWASLDVLLSSGQVTGGDRIFLLDGYHGQVTVQDQNFASPVIIAPAAGHVAHADAILVMNSSNIRFQGLKVWPRQATATNQAVVRTYADTHDLAFTDLDVRAIDTSANYASWTINDWLNYQRNGIMIDGDRIAVARNRITGIYHGIQGLASNALIEGNIIDGFAGDGMRALGDGSVVRRNKVQNCHQIDGNHTDGFQSWSRGPGGAGTGTVRNITIENNKIFEAVGARSAFNCKLQGISMFDGIYENFVIRNNVISSTAYHGITMAGGLNSLIVNNTVIHASGVSGSYPWIRVSHHKNGTPSKNVTAANNLVTSNKVTNDSVNNVVERNNVTVTNASAEFTSVSQQDFTLKSTAKAIDAGAASLAPDDDIVGSPRPKGQGPDAGAYENF